MTTVINLNILNFFRQESNKYTVNDIRFNTYHSGQKHDDPPQKDNVIDVTPFSRVVSENEIVHKKPVEFPVIPARQAKPVNNPSLINKTYDRYGNTIQFLHAKGLHIDSYV